MNEFKMIPRKSIKPDANQPRRYFDEVAMLELTNSVKEKGILQALMVRPDGTGYKLVLGERRLKAAEAAGLEEVPAIIRDINDEEALELQIIENLQRKDVHPMEEAIAFKSLVERKEHRLTIEEIAARIAKKPVFVRQRLQLNSLNDEWQKACYQNLIPLVMAIRIATLAPDAQKKLAQQTNAKEHIKANAHINVDNWHFRTMEGDLSQAVFDINDPTLSPKFGACTSCPYNSQVSSLFPDANEHPKCTNMPDYVLKTNEAYKRNFKAAVEDPAIVLVSTYHYTSDEDLKPFKKDKLDVLSQSQYDIVNFKDDDEFKSRLESGQYLKGFVVIGKVGETVYLKLKKKGKESSTAVKSEKEAPVTVESIGDEIKRIQNKEKRSKEIDGEKIWAKVRELIPNNVSSIAVDKPFTQDEKDALVAAIESKIGYQNRHLLQKLKLKNDSKKTSDAKLFAYCRVLILEALPNAYGSHLKPGGNQMVYNIIKNYMAHDVKVIETEQQGVAERRDQRVTSRIISLQAQKKELQSAAPKKPAKKSAPTKSSKKSKT